VIKSVSGGVFLGGASSLTFVRWIFGSDGRLINHNNPAKRNIRIVAAVAINLIGMILRSFLAVLFFKRDARSFRFLSWSMPFNPYPSSASRKNGSACACRSNLCIARASSSPLRYFLICFDISVRLLTSFFYTDLQIAFPVLYIAFNII